MRKDQAIKIVFIVLGACSRLILEKPPFAKLCAMMHLRSIQTKMLRWSWEFKVMKKCLKEVFRRLTNMNLEQLGAMNIDEI